MRRTLHRIARDAGATSRATATATEATANDTGQASTYYGQFTLLTIFAYFI